MYTGHWKKSDFPKREPRDPEQIAQAMLPKQPRLVAARVQWQKDQYARFGRAGVRASQKDQEKLRKQMIDAVVECGQQVAGRV